MSKALNEIRKRIDALDTTIQDALIERADIVDEIIAEKKKKTLPFIQPSREAQLIRRLLERHSGVLPEAAIVRIWRELIGAVSGLQVDLHVSVCVPDEQDVLLWEMARNYFGSTADMQRLSNALLGIASVRENKSMFAVLPWPHDDEDVPWWVHLFNQDQDIKIVCALPYGVCDRPGKTTPDQAVVISGVAFMPSGEDNSFIVLDLDHHISRARIVDVFNLAELEPISIFSHVEQASGRTMHLVEVRDYVVAGDSRLNMAVEGFEDQNIRYKPVGGYPVPPVYK